MAEFIPPYYYPMDREYHVGDAGDGPKLEEPIFPISQVGTTVPERDPAGRFRNMVQGIQANIRKGAGTMQLIWMTGPESALGGRPKAYGKEVREAIKEIALANEVKVKGFEMPTSMNNLSGFDHQRGQFSDEHRQLYLNEVKDAIKFAAEATQGGGIDMVSWEYPREINDAQWNKGEFYKPGEHKIGMVVDDRTGQIQRFRKQETLELPKEDEEGNLIIKDGEYEMETWTWDRFKGEAQKQGVTAEELFVKKRLNAQYQSMLGQKSFYLQQASDHQERMQEAQKVLGEISKKIADPSIASEERSKLEQDKQRIEERRRLHEQRYKDNMRSAAGQETQAADIKDMITHLKPVSEFAFNRSKDAYAQAGLYAMEETHNHALAKNPVYVGPEIGWPDYYGSHPEEFKKLITESRDRMVELLTTPKRKNEHGQWIDKDGNPVEDLKQAADNPYYRPDYNKKKAQEEAAQHIKGMFDTSHMGMWLANFKPLPGETEDARLKRFNKWYLEKVQDLAKSGLIGGIQLVDSASAAHGHLPPGQGIFPIKEAAKIFKDNNFTGYLVSEGHEEEAFGEGRILTKTWEALGSPIGQRYFSHPAQQWGPVQHSYFGRTYSPNFILGAYSPSNEFKLWSEVPLE